MHGMCFVLLLLGGKSPLHQAVYTNRADIAEYLIQQGADWNAKELTSYQTPLQMMQVYHHQIVGWPDPKKRRIKEI